MHTREGTRYTWISCSDNTRAREITVIIISAIGLIVGIHGICRMPLKCVRLEAGPTSLNGPTVDILACIIYVILQRSFTCIGLRHAPFLAPGA